MPGDELALRVINLGEFVRRLRAETNAEKRFALFLGAGCSVSSGIPSAGPLVVDRWIPRLRDYQAPHRADLQVWASEAIDGYDPSNPALSYGELIDHLFLTPNDRQREIEDLCEGRTPSFGYAVLAQLIAMEGGRFNIVLTTNFDDLIADALYLYTEARPLVIYHESLAAFIRPTRTRPLVVKLHGDHRLSPRNTALETQTLEHEIQRHTSMVLHDRGIIFMGYGGADLGILKLLNDLPVEALPFGAFWVHPHEPHGQVRDWLLRRQGVWVRSGWFD
ncbi:MAG: SIR2 family protein, partial [Candidatus Eisenbacteria bacterium]